MEKSLAFLRMKKETNGVKVVWILGQIFGMRLEKKKWANSYGNMVIHEQEMMMVRTWQILAGNGRL